MINFIHRYLYQPYYDMDTKTYGFKKLKVIKVYINNPLGTYNIVTYILENCMRIPEAFILTEDNLPNRNPKTEFNKHINLIGPRGIYKRDTIFSPNDEMLTRKEGIKAYNKIIKQSNEEIKFCIENDFIHGEESTNEFLNNIRINP